MSSGILMTLTEFFKGYKESRPLFDVVLSVIESIGPAALRVTKSQISFRRRTAFAWAWIPGRYLRGRPAPLVLTVALRHRDRSARWKEVVEPAPGRFTHHLELRTVEEIDQQVEDWLALAWEQAA